MKTNFLTHCQSVTGARTNGRPQGVKRPRGEEESRKSLSIAGSSRSGACEGFSLRENTCCYGTVMSGGRGGDLPWFPPINVADPLLHGTAKLRPIFSRRGEGPLRFLRLSSYRTRHLKIGWVLAIPRGSRLRSPLRWETRTGFSCLRLNSLPGGLTRMLGAPFGFILMRKGRMPLLPSKHKEGTNKLYKVPVEEQKIIRRNKIILITFVASFECGLYLFLWTSIFRITGTEPSDEKQLGLFHEIK